MLATFTLIDNVKYIQYLFADGGYQITREDVERKYPKFAKIVTNHEVKELNFKRDVTDRITQPKIITNMLESLFQSPVQ